MEEVITIGIDLAKSVFQVHGVDPEGAVVIRPQLPRRQMLENDRRVFACHHASEVRLRLEDIPGVGPLIASALVASVMAHGTYYKEPALQDI
jgi:transposase